MRYFSSYLSLNLNLIVFLYVYVIACFIYFVRLSGVDNLISVHSFCSHVRYETALSKVLVVPSRFGV